MGSIAPAPPAARVAAAALFGGSAEVVKGLLEDEGDPETLGVASLGEQIRAHVSRQDRRRRYVEAATRHLTRRSEPADVIYDIVLVGAGVHAAAFIYTLRQSRPDLRILVVERSEAVCSTFSKLGDALVLNSPTFSKVGLNANIMQGHFVQLSDFDDLAERPFPTARHLHELATMVLFHADADIRFGFEVLDIASSGDAHAVTSRDRSVRAKRVVICNGMGAPRSDAFSVDRRCERVLFGDDFLARYQEDRSFAASIGNKRVAVVGAGDTANCVMERLLPLVYPHKEYGFSQTPAPMPRSVAWVGQGAQHIRDYFFAIKTRYAHAGGLIELFWDGDSPFELSPRTWIRAKERVRFVPERLLSLTHRGDVLALTTSAETFDADLVVDCTGRFNALTTLLQQRDHHFVRGDIAFHGGRWDESLGRFTTEPRTSTDQRIACQLTGERVFFLGCATPLRALIDDDEAKDGSLMYQEERTSLTNSKWSLEHTLPRSIALAHQLADTL